MSNSHHQKSTIFWALIIILLGVLLLFNNLDYIDFGDFISDYWPVFLIIWGIYLILRKDQVSKDHSFGGDKLLVDNKSQVIHSNTFGDLNLKIESDNFESGKINNTFGDIELDLGQLTINNGEKILDVRGVFGDIKISLPKELAVWIEASVTGGDIKIFDQKVDGFSKQMHYKSDNYDSAENKLKIFVSHIFGDIKVW